MKLMIEIAAAALLVVCISATSAAFAAGKTGKSADGLGCSFSVAKDASPAARCTAIKRQCVVNSTQITAVTSSCRRCELLSQEPNGARSALKSMQGP